PAKFDFDLVLEGNGDALRGRLLFAADLYDASTMQRLMAHWNAMLAAIVADPGKRVSDIEILSDTERRRLLSDWNEAPGRRCAGELFEMQAQRTPDAPALLGMGGPRSYLELNLRANQIARYLLSLGVDRDTRTAVLMTRGPELVAAILGVLKTGATYVPLDPEYPPARLTFMMEDAQVSFVVTERRFKPNLAAT